MHVASTTRRLFAFLIDHFIILIICIGGFFVISNPFAEGSAPFGASVSIFGVLIGFLYVFRDVVGGASVGKRFLGLKIVDSNAPDVHVDVLRLGLRNLLLPLWPIEFIVLVFSAQNRRLGDMLVRTRVVYQPKSATKKFRLSVAGFLIGAFCITFLATAANVRATPAYQLMSNHVFNDESLVSEIGEVVSVGRFPSFSLRYSATESVAIISFDVTGEEGTVTARGFLRKQDDSDWIIDRVEYF